MARFKGSVLVDLNNDWVKYKRLFEVVEYEGIPLLSHETCGSFKYNIHTVNKIEIKHQCADKKTIIKENKDVFERIRRPFQNQIHLDECL